MKYFLIVFFLSSCLLTTAQKPPLDTSVFRKWASVGEESISKDGNYVIYHIYNQTAGSQRLVIQSTTNEWKREFAGAFEARFTNDSRLIILKSTNDSLCLLTLGKEESICIPHVSEFNLSNDDQGSWLAYRLTTSEGTLIIHNLINGREYRFSSVDRYLFADNGKCLLYGTQKKDSSLETALQWVNLSTEGIKTIWSGFGSNVKTRSYTLTPDGNQLAFIVENKKINKPVNELWYYKQGMDTAIKLVDDQTAGLKAGLELTDQPPTFSKDESEVFLGLQAAEAQKQKPGSVQVDVWSYTDKVLQPIQLEEAKQDRIYSAVIDIQERRVIRLEQPEENIIAWSDGFVLVKHELGYYASFESYWNSAAQSSYWLVSTRDGSRKLVKDHIVNPDEGVGLSPGGKWLLYYDNKQKNYFSYEMAGGVTRNVTKGIPTGWLDKGNDRPDYKLVWVPWRKTWLGQDEAVLIYDNYDIWMVDPSGITLPTNLTNGYGRLHHIKFGLAEEGLGLQGFTVQRRSTLLLTAFDEITKKRGFYTKTLGIGGDPQLGFMGAFVFGDWDGYGSYNDPPLKARNANTYLVKRMSAVEAPNYFVTQDFRKFVRLTDVQPQAAYNWITTELVHWKTFDGSPSTGILYKPENFDPRRKYPVIFDYYERRSDELNLYTWPRAATDRINIAWYVSNGYLVFAPDIHYKQGGPGKSAYNAVVSAAIYLSKMPWVDAKKMGLQGHSFGGYETNYIITHTALFAAACSASGMSDLISWYGAAPPSGNTKLSAEKEQGRMGSTPWQIPLLYISNSPIFKVDKVTTPLLMVSNKEDAVVPFAQGVELFTALRRLGKRVWMLQYDGSGHSVRRGKDAADYSTRMEQFFAHYLKGAPAPKWMTRGIPANLKGIDDGLSADKDIPTPGLGLDRKNPGEN